MQTAYIVPVAALAVLLAKNANCSGDSAEQGRLLIGPQVTNLSHKYKIRKPHTQRLPEEEEKGRKTRLRLLYAGRIPA